MKILDMSAGNRGIWFDKQNPFATFLDVRPEMKPDIVCDTRNIPPEVGNEYDLVVFDPPHMNCGPKSDMAKKYGHWTSDQIRDIVHQSAREAHRVTKSNGLMAFKWNDHDQKLSKMLDLMKEYWLPLFGHKYSERTKRASRSYWCLLKRVDA